MFISEHKLTDVERKCNTAYENEDLLKQSKLIHHFIRSSLQTAKKLVAVDYGSVHRAPPFAVEVLNVN
jgi:hypothetical protein